MPDTETPDHDQRLKVLLKEFFEQFFQCFFAKWADRFDFSDVTWIDKEVFLDPPQGERRYLDLVSKVRLRHGVRPPQPEFEELVTLVHIEIESRDSAAAFRPRMFEYYSQLRRRYDLPVLPIGLYLRVGLEGIGFDSYEEYFWEDLIVQFRYAYVGLPALDAATYVSGEHLLGVALSALMKTPEERRVELRAESLNRIARSRDNDYRKFLLTECLEAYGKLDEAQQQQLLELMETDPYREAKPLMITTYERGKLEGKIEGLRETATMLLNDRFGPLSQAELHRVTELTLDQLQGLLARIVRAKSLEELHLAETRG